MHCVSNVGDFVPDEECNMNLRPTNVENCDMGACAKSWFYTEWGNRVGEETIRCYRVFFTFMNLLYTASRLTRYYKMFNLNFLLFFLLCCFKFAHHTHKLFHV